jgi:hypothetical protein
MDIYKQEQYNRSYNIHKNFTPELLTIDDFKRLLKSGYSEVDGIIKSQIDRSHLIKKEVWVTRDGKYFKQTVYVRKDEPETEHEAVVGEEISPTYVNEKVYNEQMKPLIKQFLDENKELLKSITNTIN